MRQIEAYVSDLESIGYRSIRKAWSSAQARAEPSIAAGAPEWKTLWRETPAGLVGLVLPEDQRYCVKKVASALGISRSDAQRLRTLEQLPAGQTPGSCGPWLPERYAAAVLVDESIRSVDSSRWRVPGSPEIAVVIRDFLACVAHLEAPGVTYRLCSITR